jgi:succinylglutamic semialdehyde dehydrogenase
MAMKHFINGQWHTGTGLKLESLDPATGDSIWEGRHASKQDVALAVSSAKKALPEWAHLTVDERCVYLRKFHNNLEQDFDMLAKCISLDSGKPLWESKTEVQAMLGKVEISIKAHQERCAFTTFDVAGSNANLRYKPHGVVAVFGAFNFPGHLSNGHIVPALIAGNTVVYKSSEYTPLVAERVIQCWRQTGLPDGVINLIHGGKDTGIALLNQDINGVYFTGSSATGHLIHQFFSGRPDVILALEMGGNNPLIIDESDITASAYATIVSAYSTAGQRCTCARRVIVPQTKSGDDFLEALIEMSKSIHVSHYDDSKTPFMGPVISHGAAINHLQAQQQLIGLGGSALLPMELLKENTGFLSPGIIDVSDAKTIPDEEIFAPLIQIIRYDTFEQAIQIANDTKYGLAAGLLSNNEKNYQYFFKHINAGIVNWNRPLTGASSSLPFGGIGSSGNHRPSAYFAADYCAYPIASLEIERLDIPKTLLPGISPV